MAIISRLDPFPVLNSALDPFSFTPALSIVHPKISWLLQCFGVFFPFFFTNLYAYSISVLSPLNHSTFVSSVLGQPIPLQLFVSGVVMHGIDVVAPIP